MESGQRRDGGHGGKELWATGGGWRPLQEERGAKGAELAPGRTEPAPYRSVPRPVILREASPSSGWEQMQRAPRQTLGGEKAQVGVLHWIHLPLGIPGSLKRSRTEEEL